ncbi:MAG: hypothetical protein K8L99_11505, partial [Anaerolineae bacterium]|nr:hypothetical protein [Anaerolineae bacterium]
LSASLKTHLPAGEIRILTTPYDVANVVIEDLPDTLITSGRRGRNLAAEGNDRFMNEDPTRIMPWLDSDDLAFVSEWGVDNIVMLAEMSRVPQMLLQPERFTPLDTPSGYVIFLVKPDITPDVMDALYGQMNMLYAATKQPRWGRDGFNLILPGDEAAWKPIADQWRVILDEHPDDNRARLGLAFSTTMMGADADAIPIWQELYDAYPDVPLFADGLASTMQRVNPAQDSITPLMDSLSSGYDTARVLAARRLLTDTFFYRLSAEQLAQIIAVTQTDAVTWDRLANLDEAEMVRKRAALLMDAGAWAAAAEALDAIPVPERAPEDITARAAIQLVQGDTAGALDILRPAADPDQIIPNVFLHGDRWQRNVAGGAYYLMQADLAARENRQVEAEAAWQAAAMFLEPSAFGGIQSLLAITDTHSLYVMQPEVTRADENLLIVSATYGNVRPYKAFPIRTWRIQVVSPDSATKYAEVDVPAQSVDGALIRVSTEVSLPANIPALTPALVIIEPRYNDAVTATPAILPVVLNRPDSADIPAGATQTDWRFGDHIALQAYGVERGEDGTLRVNLYWQTDAPLGDDYQVFVHVLDANGGQVSGQDSAPVNNQYPTSQWREKVTIADPHTLAFEQPLTSGEYRVEIGLYKLPEGTRLTVTPADERVKDNSVALSQFTVEE